MGSQAQGPNPYLTRLAAYATSHAVLLCVCQQAKHLLDVCQCKLDKNLTCCAVLPAVQYPDDEAALGEALDALLDNPDFLDLVADEVMFQVGALAAALT